MVTRTGERVVALTVQHLQEVPLDAAADARSDCVTCDGGVEPLCA
jgi:hypothetical protein